MQSESVEIRLIRRNPMQRYDYFVEQFESRSKAIRAGQIGANIRTQTFEYTGTQLEDLAANLLVDQGESIEVLGRLCEALLSYIEISFRWRPWNLWTQRVLQEAHLSSANRSLLLYGLARYEAEMGNLDLSIATHRAALEQTKHYSLAEALNQRGLGIAYQLKQRWSQTQEALQNAMTLLETLDEPYYLAVTMANMASYYYRKEDYEPAIEWYQKTLALYNRLGDDFLADNTWYSLGWVYLNLNNLNMAHDCFVKCLELSKAHSERLHEYALGHYGLGTALYRRRQLKESIVALEQALSIFRAEANSVMQGLTCQVLADAHRKLGNYADAERILDRALQLHQQTDHTAQLAYIYLKRGKLRLAQERYEEAQQECEQAERAAIRSGRRDLRLAACITKVEACLRTHGHSEAVLALYERCAKLATRLNDSEALDRLRKLLE